MINSIRLSEYVCRAHTIPFIKEQSLASHMGRSAMLFMFYYKQGWINIQKEDYYAILEYLLIHDLHEVEFGDIPYTTKSSCNYFQKYEKEKEGEVLKKFDVNLTSVQLRIAKFFDMLEFYLKTLDEFNMGNRHMKLIEVSERAYNLLQDWFLELREESIFRLEYLKF